MRWTIPSLRSQAQTVRVFPRNQGGGVLAFSSTGLCAQIWLTFPGRRRAPPRRDGSRDLDEKSPSAAKDVPTSSFRVHPVSRRSAREARFISDAVRALHAWCSARARPRVPRPSTDLPRSAAMAVCPLALPLDVVLVTTARPSPSGSGGLLTPSPAAEAWVAKHSFSFNGKVFFFPRRCELENFTTARSRQGRRRSPC